MADDTRLPDAEPPQRPRGPANVMPGGTAHTAGGIPATGGEPTYWDVVRNLGPEYYLNFHKRPCVRDGQLFGLSAGFAIGALYGIARRPVWKCCNAAVLTWATGSCGAYQYCSYWRRKEKAGMQQAREITEQKRITIEAKNKARKKQREAWEKAEKERLEEEARQKTWSYWYNKNIKFW